MVRDIRKLDEAIKQEYGLILASLLTKLRDTDVFQLRTFYKVMAYIEMPKKHRKKVLEFLLSSEEEEISLEKSVNSLLNKVKGQERDILRFTLMQDILSISTANHYMSEDKRELLEWVQKQLLISDEQMKIFNGELNQESGLASKTKEVDRWKAYRSNFSKCLAMGIPLTFLYYSQHNAYRHDFKSFALLQIDKKINPRKSYVSLGKYLLLGGVLYTGVLWGMNQKKRHQEKLEKMLETESKNLISRGKRYLEEDLIFCQKIFRKDTLNENQINFKILMDKTLQIMDEEF